MRRLLVAIVLGGLVLAAVFGGLAVYGMKRTGMFDPPARVR